MPITRARARADARAVEKKADNDFFDEVTEWESVQKHSCRALDTKYAGMIATVDVDASYREHKQCLRDMGYDFGTYHTDLSLFEKLSRTVFRDDCTGRDVFSQAKNILSKINKGSKPKRNSLNLLHMMSTKYIVPVANMVLLLAHPSALQDDLNLFWKLTDRLWCFAHPVYNLHSGWLDETCDEITKRLQEVTARSLVTRRKVYKRS